jgi:hypothetical protein
MELDPSTRDIHTRLRQVQANLTRLQEEADLLKGQLRDQAGVGTHTVAGKTVFTIRPNRRFDAGLAERLLTPEFQQLCTITKIDAATAKRVLPPAMYDACSAEVGEPVIRLA